MSGLNALRLVCSVGLLVALAACGGMPTFSQYPAVESFKGKPELPQFDSRDEDPGHFREQVAFSAESGPNFAGRYTLAFVSCGSGCGTAVVIDAATGKIARQLGFVIHFVPGSHIGKETRSFRLGSRLLIIEGYFGEEPDEGSECSRRYYEWTGGSFKLLKKVLVQCRPTPR